jgi:hypothetical protein
VAEVQTISLQWGQFLKLDVEIPRSQKWQTIASGMTNSAQWGHGLSESLMIVTICDGIAATLLPLLKFFLGQTLLRQFLGLNGRIDRIMNRNLESESGHERSYDVRGWRFLLDDRSSRLILKTKPAPLRGLTERLAAKGA